jgi:hypothetical protein
MKLLDVASFAPGPVGMAAKAASFIGRHWRLIAAAIPIIVLSIMLVVRTGQRNHARLERDAARAEVGRVVAEAARFAADVRATAERVRSTYAANALRVEREQSQVTEEVSHEYQTRIVDLNRRVAALRLRAAGASGANPGGAAGDRYPALPDAAGGSDAAAAQAGLPAPGGLPLDDAITATEQAIQLDELIRWVQRQAAIVRTPPPAAPAIEGAGVAR